MNEIERGFIIGSLSQMDQASKNFVLGYMAGRCSDTAEHEKSNAKADGNESVDIKANDSDRK